MPTLLIGQLKIVIHPYHRPTGWSASDDFWRSSERLDDSVHKLISWSGRVAYVVEHADAAVMLSAHEVARIAACIAENEKQKPERRVRNESSGVVPKKPDPAWTLAPTPLGFAVGTHAAGFCLATGMLAAAAYTDMPLVHACMQLTNAASGAFFIWCVAGLVKAWRAA